MIVKGVVVTGGSGNFEEQKLATNGFDDSGKSALYGSFEQTAPGAAIAALAPSNTKSNGFMLRDCSRLVVDARWSKSMQ